MLAVFRRAVCAAAGWVFMRHQPGSMAYPWLLAGLADPRRAEADKHLLANICWRPTRRFSTPLVWEAVGEQNHLRAGAL